MTVRQPAASPKKPKFHPKPGDEVWFEAMAGMRQRCIVIGSDRRGRYRLADVGHLHETTARNLTAIKPQEQSADQVKELVQLAKDKGVTTTDLDTVVHDLSANFASTANNGGVTGQVQWLVEQCGAAEARRLIEEAAE